MMSLSFEELKEKGNDSVRQQKYDDAVKYYSAALELDPNSHTAYSNRSLAHSKLARFEDALHDANRCTELDPSFARGFLRKSVALTHLGMGKEAMEAAEQGYKLRGSQTICRDCVAQWLEANRLFNMEMVHRCLEDIGPEEDIIPNGCRIISDEYMTIFLNVFLCRLQSATTMVSAKVMLTCLLKLLDELERILLLFGHTLGTCARQWLESLSFASVVNPSTSKVPAEAVELVLARASEFATWFDASVDHSLFPILQPIVSLVSLAISARCISLNMLNVEQHITLITCRACLPFFEKAPLTTQVYLLQHLALYKELLEAFGTINYKMSAIEIRFGEEAMKATEKLIEKCPFDEVSMEVREKATVSISLAQIRLRQTPKYDPVQFAPESGKAISRIGKKSPEKLKSYVLQKMDSLRAVLAVPPDTPEEKMGENSYEDMQDLASCVGALVDTGESTLAAEALQLSEMSFLRYFQLQISTGSFILEEAGMSFTIPRTAILQNITMFLGLNDRLLAISIIRWKCIASEFRAILIRLGISKVYVKTFQAMQAARVKGNFDRESILTVASQHNAEAEHFMGNRGQAVLSCLFQQSVEQISSILEPGQLVLEYCFVQDDSDEEAHTLSHPSGVLVAMQTQADARVFSIDFTKVLPLALKWSKALSDPEATEDTKSIAEDLCSALIPPPIEQLLNAAPKKQVFVCPDGSLGVIPLELLLFKDGETLGEKCTTTYMSSSREFLRNAVVKAVSLFEMGFDSALPIPTEINEENISRRAENLGVVQSSTSPASVANPARTNDESAPPKESDSIRIDQSVKGTDEQGLSMHTKSANEANATNSSDKQDLARPATTPSSSTDVKTEKVTKVDECIIVAAPNFNLEKPSTGLWGSVVQGFASLFSSQPDGGASTVSPLIGAEREASVIDKILSECAKDLKVRLLKNDDATLAEVLNIQSPLILHFSTHGFSYLEHKGYRSSFWDDTKTGLLLAGANTYRQGKLEQVAVEAGTGELTALAACGMSLKGTRLVYLSACVSSYGRYTYNESINSLAEAFRSAGAETVIATLWQVFDDTAQQFASYFYTALCSSGTVCTPSQALAQAKEKLREKTSYKHWIYWSSFICIGEDKPVLRSF